MLPKKRRIPSQGFNTGFSGRTVRSEIGSLRVVGGQGEVKAAVIISKNRVKTAVSRNRLKRLVYAELAGVLPEVRTGLKLYWYPTEAFSKLKSNDRQQSILGLLREARALK